MNSILVVDGDGARRARTCALLTRLGLPVVDADGPARALGIVREEPPALVVLDHDSGGLELCREIAERSGQTGVIVVSATRTASADRVAGLLAGADDYMPVPFDPDELLARARRTLTRLAPPSIVPTSAGSLSNREREVLDLLAQGLTHRQIASELVISHKTVGAHVQHILAKLGLHSTTQAVAFVLHERLSTSSAVPPGASGGIAPARRTSTALA